MLHGAFHHTFHTITINSAASTIVPNANSTLAALSQPTLCRIIVVSSCVKAHLDGPQCRTYQQQVADERGDFYSTCGTQALRKCR
jgi:hypothetical protein